VSTDSQSAAHIFEVAVPPSRLNPRDVELIAARVAEILSDTESWPGPARFADAATIAEKLGVDRNWVYAHARELGAVRLGGSRGRLRFDLEQVERALVCREQPPPKRGRPRRLRRGAAQVFGVELLPVRGIQSLDTANSGRGARQRPRPDTGR
jgi:hypothetical protein